MKKIRKGALVRLNKDVCFTERTWGQASVSSDQLLLMMNVVVVEAGRPTTREEQDACGIKLMLQKGWIAAGETKLPPQSYLYHSL